MTVGFKFKNGPYSGNEGGNAFKPDSEVRLGSVCLEYPARMARKRLQRVSRPRLGKECVLGEALPGTASSWVPRGHISRHFQIVGTAGTSGTQSRPCPLERLPAETRGCGDTQFFCSLCSEAKGSGHVATNGLWDGPAGRPTSPQAPADLGGKAGAAQSSLRFPAIPHGPAASPFGLSLACCQKLFL